MYCIFIDKQPCFLCSTFFTGKYTFEKIDESPLRANSNKEMNCSSRMTMYANETNVKKVWWPAGTPDDCGECKCLVSLQIL